MPAPLRTKLRIVKTVLGASGFFDALAGRFLWQPAAARPLPFGPSPGSFLATLFPFTPRSSGGRGFDREPLPNTLSNPLPSDEGATGGEGRRLSGGERAGGEMASREMAKEEIAHRETLRGALHVHTCTYSDGAGTIEEVMAAASAAGVDFVLLTDHNTMRPKADGLEDRYAGQRPFLIVGDELTVEGGAFLLALDLPGDFDFPPRLAPQAAIDAVVAAGGLPLVSLPDDMKHPWEAWDARGCAGLEVLNLSTVARLHINILSLLWLLPLWRGRGELAVLQAICARPDATLARWDALLAQGKKQIGLGALDAHALMKIGKKKHPIPSYENSFRALTTHVLTEAATPAGVHDALRAGRCYFVYDCLGEPGVRFATAEGVPMGGEAPVGSALVASASDDALLRLYFQGKVIAAGKGNLSYTARLPGAYRLEVYRVGRQRGPLFVGARPWAFTNPIYLK